MSEDDKQESFGVFVEAEGYEKPLILTGLTFARLFDDIVKPFQTDEPMFVDGAPLEKKMIRKIKILSLRRSDFGMAFGDLNYGMREGNDKIQKLYGEQYHIRLEAALRECGEDVTSQIIKAFETKVKPGIKEYLPKRDELISAASKFFWEGIKTLSGT